MSEKEQYLRIGLSGVDYLLPGNASFAIEQRDSLMLNSTKDSPVTAWRSIGGQRWPAFYLDAKLKPLARNDWQRAVFLEADPYPVGLIANEVQLLPRGDIHAQPFSPLGPPTTAAGHLFNGAWVSEARLVMVFNPKALSEYLLNLERGP